MQAPVDQVVTRDRKPATFPIEGTLGRRRTRFHVTVALKRDLALPFPSYFVRRALCIAGAKAKRGRAMADSTDADLRNIIRLISVCTLGLWTFAAGLLIGVFLF